MHSKILWTAVALCIGLSGLVTIAMAERQEEALSYRFTASELAKPVLSQQEERLWYGNRLQWMVEEGFFQPDGGGTPPLEIVCTRGQFLSFFWQICGRPESEIPNPYTDMTESDRFYLPALWAWKLGLVSERVFGPEEACSWEEALQYLWKAAGSPPGAASADVSGTSAQVYTWALENRLLPEDEELQRGCTRQEAAALLYRIWREPDRILPMDRLVAREILYHTPVIAHAMGAASGMPAYLNCLEGFQAQYAAGVRVFEADLLPAADGQVVLRHDWEGRVPTGEEFLSTPLGGKYTPLSFGDLLRLMVEYPDVCIITDSKYTEAEEYLPEFGAMVAEARELGLEYLFERIVVQVYSADMYETLRDTYGFSNYVYTLYAEGFGKTKEAFRAKAGFCAEEGILGITMWDYWWNDAYRPIAEELGVPVYVHTVNSLEDARRLLSGGVSVVYTDYLTPGQLE